MKSHFTTFSERFFDLVFIAVFTAAFHAGAPATQAQSPSVFAADDPSGSVSSNGANLAYLRNTSGNDESIILDGTPITVRATRLNVFDRSSGAWILKALMDPQSQAISPGGSPSATPTPTPTPTATPGNNFLTGLYEYFGFEDATNSASWAGGSYAGKLLGNYGTISVTPGKIGNKARGFLGNSGTNFAANGGPPNYNTDRSSYSPGSNHFFVSLWFTTNVTNYNYDAGLIGKFNIGNSDAEWLVHWDPNSHKIRLLVSYNATCTSSAAVVTSLPINDGNWHFLVAGWDGTNIKISLDGGAYSTVVFSGPAFSGTGQAYNIGAEGGSNRWNGSIDEVAIWIGRNDLTMSDVQQLYNNGAGLPFSSFQ